MNKSILDVIDLWGTKSAEIKANSMGSSQLLVRGKAFLIKQALDFILTSLILITFSPWLFLIMLAIKIGSPGPVFYKQIRLGEKGKPFSFYKFRSMYVNTDDAKHRSYVKKLIKAGNPYVIDENGKPLFKISDDERVTRVGRLIRKYSVDEFPQLLNVLKGEMSLVGPRPPLPHEYRDYRDWHKKRLDGIPGITGLWQVSGKDRISFEEMVKLDIHYLKNWSLWLDIKIILRTIPVMLKGEGC
jgi:lipopolysaccharide/colanic/teichoic acid biosynthesis glycosyltransferase